MDGSRFDALTKSLALSGSRRRVLAGLLGGALGAVGLGRAEGAECRPDNSTCREHANCCSKLCNPPDAQHRRRCGPSPTTTTTTSTSPTPSTTTSTTSTTTSTTSTTTTSTTPPPSTTTSTTTTGTTSTTTTGTTTTSTTAAPTCGGVTPFPFVFEGIPLCCGCCDLTDGPGTSQIGEALEQCQAILAANGIDCPAPGDPGSDVNRVCLSLDVPAS